MHHGIWLFTRANHFFPVFHSNNILLQTAILNAKNNNDIITSKRNNAGTKFNKQIKQNISNDYSNEIISYINNINKTINCNNNNITTILNLCNIINSNYL